MSIKIISNRDELLYGVNTYILDTKEDLPNLSFCYVGSTAIIAKTGETYRKANDGSWFRVASGGGGSSTDTSSYISKQYIKDYLYETYYLNADYSFAKSYFKSHDAAPSGACSAVRKGNYYGRNFDWVYSEDAEFILHLPHRGNYYASLNVAGSVPQLTNSFVRSDAYHENYKILPFFALDGINEKGVVCNTNVVPTDKGENLKTIPEVEEKEEICALMLVRYILDKFDSAQAAAEYIRDYVSVFQRETLRAMHYEIHLMIADADDTYLLEFIDNANVITKMDDTTLQPYMTNFYLSDITLNSDGSVYTPQPTTDPALNAYDYNHITLNGCGLERYNLINSNYSSLNTTSYVGMRSLMNHLSYSNSYKTTTSPFWYTEFVGVEDPPFTVKSSTNDYPLLPTNAQAAWDNRTRDKEDTEHYGVWHTSHSSVYDIAAKELHLIAQEDGQELTFDMNWSPILP